MIYVERPALMRLTTEYKLLKKDSKVSFDAVIEFSYDGKETTLDSKLIIVSAEVGSHDIVFLLNVRLIAMHFPDTFRSDKDTFSYESGSLIIEGSDKDNKKYRLNIHPLVNSSTFNQLN